MAFKEAKGNKTVEAFVRGCGRPAPTAEATMQLAEVEAKRVIAL